MTTSPEARVSDSSEKPLGTRPRADPARAQEAVLPSGRVVVSCAAPLGVGGLGRHLSEILDALHRREQPTTCICDSTREPATESSFRRARERALGAVLALPPLRTAPSRLARDYSVEFDAYATERLPPADHLIGFNGTSLGQFRAATSSGFQSTALVAANSHLRRVVRQHAKAYRQHPLEGSWAPLLLERNLAEYERADRIYVASRYTHESFVEEGFSEDRLAQFPLTPDPRYTPDARARAASGAFEIVYVGSLTVAKGVPLLIDAVRALPHADLRLVLVGGWKSRGVRRFIQRACAGDSRISAGPGDPLPRLRSARLFVHPAYEDGFAYAPAEALACGVPVLVNEDTGMKDLLDPPRNGLILPTGDLAALREAIDAAYRGEVFS